jgi:hypothetical protein
MTATSSSISAPLPRSIVLLLAAWPDSPAPQSDQQASLPEPAAV